MSCPPPEVFGAFVSGELADGPRDELELHVDSCASCRMTLSELGRGAARAVPVEARIGRYAIAGELGAGAMGVVYLARDEELDRDVAVKLVHSSADDELVQQRVLREGRALARIDHQNVVRVFDVGRAHGALFVAMERARGVSLREWLAQPRTRAQIVDVFAQCAHGLAAAHAAGVIHRDFKPDNVVVDEGGHARVTDFGLAQTPDAATSRGVVGTPAYMAPEQHRGGTSDARVDQFAWGVAFAEALTGTRTQTPNLASVPRRLRRVITRALARDADARFASMTDVVAALRPRRHWWFVVAAVAVAGIAVAFALREPRDACANVADAIDGVWSDARAERISGVFASSGRSFADRAWSYARARTDVYVTAWKSARVDVCRAGAERGEVAAASRERVVRCLDRRVMELEALLARWESAQVDALAAAPSMIDGLAPASACSIASDDAAPATLHVRFAVAQAAARAGQMREAQAQLVALDRELAAYPALRAEVLVELASAERDLGARDTAREHLVAALAAAESAQADRARARAYIGLAQSSSDDFVRVSEARESLRLATAVLERLGNPGDLVRLHAVALGLTELRANEPAAALVAFRRALVGDLSATERGTRMQMLARALIASGDVTRALAELEAAEKVLVDALGPDAPQLVYVFNSMMEPLLHLGRAKEGAARGERALALFDASYGTTNPRRASVLGNLAGMYSTMGDTERAKELDEQALAIVVANSPGTLAEANTRLNLSQAVYKLGDLTGAITYLEGAKQIYTTLFGPHAPQLANVYGALADAHARLNRPAEALANTERELEIRESSNTPPGYLAYSRFHAALALEANGQHARAVELAKRALELPLATTGREADLARQIREWLAK